MDLDLDDTPADTGKKEDVAVARDAEPDVKDEPAPMQADDDDAVEY